MAIFYRCYLIVLFEFNRLYFIYTEVLIIILKSGYLFVFMVLNRF